MKTIRSTLAAIISLISTQAAAETATGTASANVQALLSVSNKKSLDLGVIAPGTTSSTVYSDGSVIGGNATLLTPGSEGAYTVTGAPNQSFSALVSPDSVLQSGSNSMGVILMNSILPYQLDATGKLELAVRGGVVVDPGQPGGNYTGTYTITVNY